MEIVFLGSGAFGLPCLDALRQSEHMLRLVVSQPPQPAGRGRKPNPTPVAQWAQSHNIPVLECANVNTPEVLATIGKYCAHVMVVIAFGQKIGPALIALPSKGMINVHASVLPQLRGAAPINWAILKGYKTTGVSIITLAEEMDAGDVLASASMPIEPHETAGELHDRLACFSAPVLMDCLQQIQADTVVYTPQDHTLATFAPKLKKIDGHLDFSLPSDDIEKRVRAFWPWPGASALYVSSTSGKRTRVILAKVESMAQSASSSDPGVFDNDLKVVCGNGRLSIKALKPAGSPLMCFKDFVNGRKIVPGDKLVSLGRDVDA